MSLAFLLIPQSVFAHHPWRCHGFHRSYYVINGGCWPSYSFSCYPTVYYTPVIYTPVIYTPVIYQPVIYPPVMYTPVCTVPVLAQPVSETRVMVGAPSNASRRVARTAHPPTLQPYSPVWTESAIGIIDELMERGEWEIAAAACKRMEKVASAKSHQVLIRQAIFDLAAHRETLAKNELNHLLDLFDEAVKSGSALSQEELPRGSLGRYLESSCIGLDSMLDELSRRVLEAPEVSGQELLVLSVLLRLDGQSERAELFSKGSQSLVATMDSFRWQSILSSLNGRLQGDSLLASQHAGR